MHASIWKLRGDADDLVARYDALLADLGVERVDLNLCLRAPDGIVIVDTCPSREAFDAFIASEDVRALLARHGLADAVIEDFPVHAAIVSGTAVPGLIVSRRRARRLVVGRARRLQRHHDLAAVAARRRPSTTDPTDPLAESGAPR